MSADVVKSAGKFKYVRDLNAASVVLALYDDQ
jgi:hypothetical protein